MMPHKINIQCRPCHKTFVRVQQGSTFQEEMVVILAYRQTIEQTLLKVSCYQHLVPKFLIP